MPEPIESKYFVTELGTLEVLILLTVYREGPVSGMDATRAMASSMKKSPATRTIYSTLEGLERRGFLYSSLDATTGTYGPKRHRTYRITAAGRDSLHRITHALKSAMRKAGLL